MDPGRLERSLALQVRPVGRGRYRVWGGREPHWVDVYTRAMPRCDCGDHLWRERVCKHILAVLLRAVAGHRPVLFQLLFPSLPVLAHRLFHLSRTPPSWLGLDARPAPTSRTFRGGDYSFFPSSTLMGICLGLASSALGISILSTPPETEAVTFSASTLRGSGTLRSK